jgi:WD40 repeat protein
MTFDGFISYSHAADGRLAPAVQRGLHRLAKPWHRRRALWIFRDQTGLAVTPGLWSSIQTALDGSEYFVLMASPEAAGSPWVNREIEHWIATKTADRILPVVTDGEWAWDAARGDFAEDSTAVPAALRGVFTEEPFFLDLRWARGSEHLSLHHSRFRDAIAQLAAPMHGLSKDELEGEDVRQHRRAKRLRSGAVVTLVVLALVASLTGLSAVRNADRAKLAAAEALRQTQVANEQRDNAQRSAEDARLQQELARQQQDRASRAAAEAKEAERVAKAQQALADQAAAEAKRQRKLADEATGRKQEQEKLAADAADRARKAQKEADRLAAVAKEKQRLANEAAAQADKQLRLAVSRRLVNQAQLSLVDDPKTALMMGAAAQSINPDTATLRQLTGVLTTTNYAGSIDELSSAAYVSAGVAAGLGTDGRVSLWNVSDPRTPVRLAVLGDKALGTLRVSPDGKTVAFISVENRAVLWDVSDRAKPVRIASLVNNRIVTKILFSADGHTFITGDAGGVIVLWDTTDRTHPERLTAQTLFPNYPVTGMALSSRGLLIVTQGIYTSHLDVSEPSIPEDAPVVVGYPDDAMTFNPDGTIVFVPTPGGVDLYDATATTPWTMRSALRAPVVTASPSNSPYPTPTEIMTPPGEHPPDLDPDYAPYNTLTGIPQSPSAVTVSPDGSLVAAGDSTGTVKVWDMSDQTGSPLPVGSMRAKGPINSVSFDATGKKLLTADASGTATVWNVRAAGAPDALATLVVPDGTAKATTFRPDGRSLLVARSGGKASMWNTADPSRPVRGADVALSGGAVRTVAFSPDNRQVATVASDTGALTVSDTAGPARTTTLTTLPSGGTMLFSPDGRTLAVFADNATLMLWDLANRARPALVSRLTGVTFSTAAAFSPDGRVLVTAGRDPDRTITLWNVADRAAPVRLTTVAGLSGSVRTLAFRPDGRYLASGDSDSKVVLWNVADAAHPVRLSTLLGHAEPVTTAGFSPDGRTLVTGDYYGQSIIWDTTILDSPLQLAQVRGDYGSMADETVFRRDGNTVAVTIQPSRDPATVMLWSYQKLNSLRADPARYACAVTGRGLTPTEWARLIPELRYRKSC